MLINVRGSLEVLQHKGKGTQECRSKGAQYLCMKGSLKLNNFAIECVGKPRRASAHEEKSARA